MIRTLQIDRYQLRRVMDDFIALVEDENSIYYKQRIPYSSWKLLRKVSNWEGLIFVEYTDKELNFSNGKETVTLVDDFEHSSFIDLFYSVYKYKWKCEKDIVNNLIKTAEVDLTLNQAIDQVIKPSGTLLSSDSTSGTLSASYLNDHQIYDTWTKTEHWLSLSNSGLSATATTDDLS